MSSSALGKGFDSLLPTDFDSSILADEKHRIQEILITDITPNKNQPRSIFNLSEIEQLSSSIKQYGILQPLILRPHDGGYQIVAGERRWRAAQHAGFESVPAIVRSLEELTELEISLIENIQRVDLSPLEQARSIHRLNQQFSLKFDEIASRLGKAVSTVHNLSRLLQLPQIAQDALANNQITEGHARAVLALKGESGIQEKLTSMIITNKWTVRQAEQFAIAHKKGLVGQKAKARAENSSTPETIALSKSLKTPVNIKRTAKGGELQIHFKDDKDLAKLLKKISVKE